MNWHNEKDAHAAEWLRNLISLSELPDGVVDERSIVDVRGDDLAGYDELHFFAGIGVWPRAIFEAERAGNCRLPRPVWSGSPPCQPLSVAGQRKGHVDERHLWPAFHRLIAERRPATILGEQVAGRDGREWMAAVRHDLEASGYAVGTAILPAGGFGAPHIRYRLFFVAYANGGQSEQLEGQGAGTIEAVGRRAHSELAGRGDAGLLADADGWDAGAEGLQRGGEHRQLAPDGGAGRLADADGAGSDRQWSEGLSGDVYTPYGHNVDRRGAPLWPSASDSFWSDADWIFCRDDKWRPIEPGSFPLVDGSAFLLGSGGPYEGMSRAGMLRGYGNAVVLPVARAFVEIVLEVFNE